MTRIGKDYLKFSGNLRGYRNWKTKQKNALLQTVDVTKPSLDFDTTSILQIDASSIIEGDRSLNVGRKHLNFK